MIDTLQLPKDPKALAAIIELGDLMFLILNMVALVHTLWMKMDD